jgi:hypothetical protein
MNMPEQHGGFYQFPLCLLSEPIKFSEMLSLGFGFGVIHYKRVSKKQFKTACKVVGVVNASEIDYLDKYNRVAAIKNRWELTGRKTSWVRLRSDIFFSTRDRDSLSERDWRVLCAIYSAIGDKDMVKLGWKSIQAKAAGWLNQPVISNEAHGPLYPRNQIERSVDEIVARGLVFVATYRRGERYWTHRHDHVGLWKQIDERKLRRVKAAAERKRFDKARSAFIDMQLHPETPQPHPEMMRLALGSHSVSK